MNIVKLVNRIEEFKAIANPSDSESIRHDSTMYDFASLALNEPSKYTHTGLCKVGDPIVFANKDFTGGGDIESVGYEVTVRIVPAPGSGHAELQKVTQGDFDKWGAYGENYRHERGFMYD